MSEDTKYGLKAGLIVVGIFLAVGVFIALLVKVAPKDMSNEQIVEQTNYCKENGMETERTYNGLTFGVIRVICSEPSK